MVVLIVIISLSILIFFHEFGHFIVSKVFHVKVEEFGFGYPPRIFGFVKVKNKRSVIKRTRFLMMFPIQPFKYYDHAAGSGKYPVVFPNFILI